MLPSSTERIGSITRPARGPWRSLTLLLMTLCLPRAADAQVLYGTLTGNVSDATGGVAVGAKVEAVNVGTNVVKTATTDDRGVYLFSDLQPGVYDVTIDAHGFDLLTRKDLRIDANTVRRLDAELRVSGATETVEVSAAAAGAADRSRRHPRHADRPAGQRPAAHRQPGPQLPEPDADRPRRR